MAQRDAAGHQSNPMCNSSETFHDGKPSAWWPLRFVGAGSIIIPCLIPAWTARFSPSPTRTVTAILPASVVPWLTPAAAITAMPRRPTARSTMPTIMPIILFFPLNTSMWPMPDSSRRSRSTLISLWFVPPVWSFSLSMWHWTLLATLTDFQLCRIAFWDRGLFGLACGCCKLLPSFQNGSLWKICLSLI